MVRVPIRVLGLSITPIKEGNCEKLVLEALKAAQDQGDVETEFITLADKKINMCQHCQWCIEHRSFCRIDDDANSILERMAKADGIIFSSPTWNRNLCPLFGILISRSRSINFFFQSFRNKVGGFITCGFLGFGLERALDIMIMSVYGHGIIPVAQAAVLSSTVSFGQRPAYTKQGVLDDARGMVFVRNVGIRVVEVARMIKFATEAGVKLPKPPSMSTGRRIREVQKIFIDGVWRGEEDL